MSERIEAENLEQIIESLELDGMYGAEATTKDGNQGTLVMADTIEAISCEIDRWIEDCDIDPNDVAPVQVIRRADGAVVATIQFAS